MKRIGRAGAISIAAGLLLLSACAPAETAREETEWDIFLSQTNEQHKTSVTQYMAPDLTDYPYPDTLAGTYDTQDPWYLDSGAGKSTLTAQEAKEDAEALFQLLHDFYGGYGYFGGDEAFQPVLEQVLNDLSGEKIVSAKSLQQSLEDALTPLILDGHFAINGHFLCAAQRLNMYYVPGLYLDGEQAADMDPLYVKRTIGADGALTWCFASLSSDGSDLPETLGKYTGLAWTLAEAAPDAGTTVYERREAEALGYPVPEEPGEPVIQKTDGAWVEQDSVIFCLTDYATASAGEWFVGDLRTMEHVVFVGSNTCGATLMTNNQTYCLPHSGLSVSFGTSLMLTPDGNREETGFQPDLWVPPQEALEAVSRLCEYYGLNP